MLCLFLLPFLHPGHFSNLIVLELGQVHGTADNEHTAGDGQAGEDFAKDDEAPKGVEEDAYIRNKADDNRVSLA